MSSPRLKIGQRGYAYVVDGKGKLIAHPDISLVLRDTDCEAAPGRRRRWARPKTPAARGVAQNSAGTRC